MALKFPSTMTAALVGAGLLVTPVSVESCGPFITTAAFTFVSRPELPASYSQGQFGIVLPAYPRLYRFVAWRYLSGVGLNAGEQKAITPQQQIGEPASEWISEWSVSLRPAPKAWLTARGAMKGLPPPLKFDPGREVNYASYVNCGDDAFRSAAETLAARAKSFGPSSAELRDWVQGQDTVFSNCKQKQAMPAPAPSGASTLLQADRAYQLAAAHFYAGDFDEAASAFRRIVAGSKSPWRATAAYLIARVHIRNATLSNPEPRQAFGNAEKQLHDVLSDASLAAVHASARSLLGFVQCRVDPAGRLVELGHALVKPGSQATLPHDLVDYRFLFDKLESDAKMPALASQDELTDWLSNYGDTAHALSRWRATQSLPWLLASLAGVPRGDPALPELLKAADRVRPDSPGYASLAFYSNRLLIESGRVEEARQRLDSILSGGIEFPRSAMNLFLAERMRVAASWEEFLKFSPRIAVGSSNDASPDSGFARDALRRFAGAPLFDADSVGLFNAEIPLNRIRDAATGRALPDALRATLARAGWVRAVLLGDESSAADFARALVALDSTLEPALDAWLSAPADSKRFAAVFLLLNHPGANPILGSGFGRLTRCGAIDDYRDNWWCAIHPKNDTRSGFEDGPLLELYRSSHPSAAFLPEPDRQRAAAEWGRLQALPAAPNWLANQTVEFARAHPDDPRVAQALHLAVRATRYGCTNAHSGAASKQAFDLLHRKYPNSEWARKTRFWYGSQGAPQP